MYIHFFSRSNATSIVYNILFTDETLFNDAFDLNEPTQELFNNELAKVLLNDTTSSLLENEIEFLDEIIDSKKLSLDKNQQNVQNRASKSTTHLVVIILLLLLKQYFFYFN
jgi:hypothetical protein